MIESLHIQRDTVAGKMLVAAKLNVRFKSLLEEEGHVGGGCQKMEGSPQTEGHSCGPVAVSQQPSQP